MTEIYGIFDGQNMITEEGKYYPVPANYSSKSMLLEGDGLKLVVQPDGRLTYKQIAPLQYKRLIVRVTGITEDGATVVTPNNRYYKVLLASATYHHLIPSMRVTVRVPANTNVTWAALESVVPAEPPRRDLDKELAPTIN